MDLVIHEFLYQSAYLTMCGLAVTLIFALLTSKSNQLHLCANSTEIVNKLMTAREQNASDTVLTETYFFLIKIIKQCRKIDQLMILNIVNSYKCS